MQNNPLVSICCLTYNHAPYIRQCIESFLMQQTNFLFEVLIHDDASTDETTDIIREYERKYPDIIYPIYQTVNQYSQGIKVSATYNFPRARGKYIAMCEGDDYWIDPLKLQKQVDFLEKHNEYVICSHKYQQYIQEENKFGRIMPIEICDPFTYCFDYYIHRNIWVTQTLTCVFLRSALNISHYLQCSGAKDLTLFYYILQKGKGYFFIDNMGVYRKHKGGVWTSENYIQMKLSDLDAIKGIYDVEKSDSAALMMKTYLQLYLTPKDCIFNLKLYKPYLNILVKRYSGFNLIKFFLDILGKDMLVKMRVIKKAFSLFNK